MTDSDENPDIDPTGGEAEPVDAVAEFFAENEAETVATGPDPGAEIEKWKDVAARAQADLDNFRKRMARERAEAIQYANRDLLEQLLPVIDNFEMGLKAAETGGGSGSPILQGMSMVKKQLEDFLGDQGVEVIPSDGLPFDPNVHEALKQEPHDTLPEGHVISTLRRGYRLKDRLLRAANVVVSSGPAGEA